MLAVRYCIALAPTTTFTFESMLDCTDTDIDSHGYGLICEIQDIRAATIVNLKVPDHTLNNSDVDLKVRKFLSMFLVGSFVTLTIYINRLTSNIK